MSERYIPSGNDSPSPAEKDSGDKEEKGPQIRTRYAGPKPVAPPSSKDGEKQVGILSGIKSVFLGGTSKAVINAASGIADIVERWKPGEGTKHDRSMEIQNFLETSYESARKYDSPMNSGLPILDGFVNGINRLIRPWVTITVIGSLFGYWELPPPNSIEPQYWTIAQIILGFWFGGRFLVKDIPQGIKSILK